MKSFEKALLKDIYYEIGSWSSISAFVIYEVQLKNS